MRSTTAPPPLLAADTRALVVVDTGVAGWEGLTQGLEPTTALLLLNPAAHGLLQLSLALDGLRAPLHSIHLIGHGQPGRMRLGAGTLDLASLPAWAPHWQRIGQALGGDGALVLYGCELARGAAGRRFIDALAGCVGAEVTASSRRVGAVALGGDWALDHHTGRAPAASALHPAAMAGFAGVLGRAHSFAGKTSPGIDRGMGGQGASKVETNSVKRRSRPDHLRKP